jgi:hypothetical protein
LAPGSADYCFKRPQYFWTPLSQQPVFMQSDCRKPQLVTQVEIEPRSGLLLQTAMQVFCSPLHRMGAANAASMQSRPRPINAAATSESMTGFMRMSISHCTLILFDNCARTLILR